MSAMARRAATILTALVLLAAHCAAPAGADGDPASDILLGENVFYPYQPAVSGSIAAGLDAATAAAHQAGFPLKVALIASPIDLGTVPELFGKPQAYANYLDVEISFQGKQPVLVVMADGYGLQGAPSAAVRALPTLARPRGASPNALALAATAAVARLAAADGHPIDGERDATPHSAAVAGADGHGSDLVLLAAVAAAAVLTAGLVLAARSRPRRPRR
jgi:hypothetical protein